MLIFRDFELMKINIRFDIYLINLLFVIKSFFSFSNHLFNYRLKMFLKNFYLLKLKRICAHSLFEYVPTFWKFLLVLRLVDEACWIK